MGHKVVEAIIENGQLKHVGGKLPAGILRVHLIYDIAEKSVVPRRAKEIVDKTAGIYSGIDAAREAKKLRRSWERESFK